MHSQPKIVHTIPTISNEASGPSYSVVRLCEALNNKGLNATMATLDSDLASTKHHFVRSFPLGLGPSRLGQSFAMKKWLVEQARSNKIELLHNHSLWMMPNIYPGVISKKYGIPLMVSPRGTLSKWAMQYGSFAKRIFWPALQKQVLEQATCFHATAHSEYEDIRRYGFNQPVAIIPNGIDVPRSLGEEDLAAKKDKRTLLFLGRIHPTKGVDILLKSWGEVFNHFPDWWLQIVGPDNDGYLNEMKSLASKLNLERVQFPGPLFGEDKIKAYQNADIFVLPTHSENFGMTVAESLAVGTPAIVSKGAPWSGLVTHSAGWWIETGIESLVVCLKTALSTSHEELHNMGSNGRKWMIEEYSWEHLTTKLIHTYKWVLDKGDKPDCVIDV